MTYNAYTYRSQVYQVHEHEICEIIYIHGKKTGCMCISELHMDLLGPSSASLNHCPSPRDITDLTVSVYPTWQGYILYLLEENGLVTSMQPYFIGYSHSNIDTGLKIFQSI